jgi:hypothetical protein
VAEPHQVTGRRQPREPGTHDDDVGLGWHGHVIRLSRHAARDISWYPDGPKEAPRGF